MQGMSTLTLSGCTRLASWARVETLERFRAEIVDEAFVSGFECEHDGIVLWFVQSGQRIEFALNVEGLCAARHWLVGLDRRLLVA